MSTNVIMLLNNNEVVGHSTDTVFAFIGKVNKENIYKINSIKQRQKDKPLQILFNNLNDVLKIIEINDSVKEYIIKNINHNTSYIVKVKKTFSSDYLLPSFNGTIMFRIPKGEIQNVLIETKMLFATSANNTGETPMFSKDEFKKRFPNIEAFGNETSEKASKIVDLSNNKIEIVRR